MQDQALQNISQNLTKPKQASIEQSNRKLADLKQLKTTTSLFKKMAATWGAKWSSHLVVDEELSAIAVIEWSKSLEGLTEDQINKAHEKCKNTLEWCPSVSQFKRYALDIVPAAIAFENVLTARRDGKYFTKLIEDSSKEISSWEWSSLKYADLKKRFTVIYENNSNELLCGNDRE